MFRGVNSINLDAKGRLSIPSRYRAQILEKAEGKLVVTIDTEEHCLLLYPMPAWEEIERKIESLPSFNKITRRIQRLLIGHATEVELDKNGRILLPPLLREYAGIDRSVMLVGQGKKFEIWAGDNWNECREEWLTKTSDQDGVVPEELKEVSL